MGFSSAATDGDDNFKLVARDEHGAGVLAFRDNFAIAFNGDALASVAELLDQTGYSQRCGKVAKFAVDLEF